MREGVIAAGNWILDKVKEIDRWPGEGNLCNILAETRSCGGGPCNILFDLAAIDPELPLYAAGRVGCDEEGDYLLGELRSRGIDAAGMIRSAGGSTSYTDVMSGCGRRTFFHRRGVNAELSCADLAGIEVPARFFYLGYLLLLDRLDATDPDFGTVAARLLHTMRGKGYETVVDFVSEAPEKFRAAAEAALPHVDVLLLNEVEASACSGRQLRSDDGRLVEAALRPAAESLLECGVRKLVVIHYPEGAAALQRDGLFLTVPSCEISPGEIVGANGAGDAFGAGVLYGLCRRLPLEQTLALGSASSYFNLLSPTASGGAVSAARLRCHLASCGFPGF